VTPASLAPGGHEPIGSGRDLDGFGRLANRPRRRPASDELEAAVL
jgi:hypothetical protein